MWAIDRKEEQITKIFYTSATHVEEINGENSLDLVTNNKVDKYDAIIFKDRLENWQEFLVQETEEARDGFRRVYAEHSVYELHDFIVRDKRPEDRTVDYILSEILQDTRWEAGTSNIGGVFSMSFYYLSAYESLKKLVKEVNGEIEFEITVVNNRVTSRKINIKQAIGQDRGQIFAYNKNLVGVKRSIKDDVVTAIVGRGRGEEISENGWGRRITFAELDKPDSPEGVDYVANDAARLAFGLYHNGEYLHRFGEALFDEIEDPEELYLETKKVLDEKSTPKFKYDVPVVLLNKPEEAVALGDTVHVIDNDFGGEVLRIHGRALKISHDLVVHEHSELTIGKVVEDMSEYQKKVDEVIDNFRSKSKVWDRSNAFDEEGRIAASYIFQLLEEWNHQANMSGGYTYTLDGMGTITYDRPVDDEPTQAVQIVGGTMRIADSKDINGEWEWKTVINAQGIAGQQILTGTITTSHLRGDVGENLDISSNTAIVSTVSQIGGLENDLIEFQNEVIQTATENITRFQTLQTEIENVDGELRDSYSYITTIIRESAEGIEVGKEGSPFKIVIGNEQIQFWENNDIVADISNNTLNIADGIFFNIVRIGDFRFSTENDGGLSFGKITTTN